MKNKVVFIIPPYFYKLGGVESKLSSYKRNKNLSMLPYQGNGHATKPML